MAKALQEGVETTMKSNIDLAIDKMDNAVFTDKDPGTTPKEEMVDEATIQAIAEKCAKPWIHGIALHRFAKQHGVSLKVVREINDAVEAKRKALVPAPVENFEE